jgi:iron uptake system EfeUOB component EfeO/EfeM
MRKRFRPMLAVAAVAVFSLTACGTTANQPAQNTPAQNNTVQNNTQPSNSEAAQPASANLQTSVQQMLDTAGQLKDLINKKDAKQVPELGKRLEDQWHSFEDSVRAKYPDLYEKVEKDLDPLVAGSSASPTDTATLGKLDDSLIKTLNELKSEVAKAK